MTAFLCLFLAVAFSMAVSFEMVQWAWEGQTCFSRGAGRAVSWAKGLDWRWDRRRRPLFTWVDDGLGELVDGRWTNFTNRLCLVAWTLGSAGAAGSNGT